MKYILFLFFISLSFAFNANGAADIVNKNCNPEAASCQRDVLRKFINAPVKSADREAAMAQCSVAFEECRAANGGIQQSNGRIAQMYHPANPRFIECRKDIPDPTSDGFAECMRGANKTPKRAVTNDNPTNQVVVVGPPRTCSKRFPSKCKTEAECRQNNGEWNGTACIPAQCPAGTTVDAEAPEMCNCNGAVAGVKIEAGSSQKCPSMCKPEHHQVYDPLARSCACAEGYEDRSGLGLGQCGPKISAAVPQVEECMRELQEKVASCNTAAATAVEKCNPNREALSGDDTLSTLQNLLGGVNSAVQAKNSGTGAMDNCMNAGIASTSGYYALEELRGKCDGEINSCKTSCSDATSYIAANKDKVYQQCRKKVWDQVSCMAQWATPYDVNNENTFNSQWDEVNKQPFENKIRELTTHIADNNTKCDTGTAATNRDQISNFMGDMNNSVKSAAQCQCQLSSASSGQDCSKQVGPAECALNPSLAGCAKIAGNCLDARDTSVKCVCFRNPGSEACKASQLVAAKMNPTETSGFAGTGAGNGSGTSAFGGGEASGKTETGGDIAGDLSGLNADGDYAAGTSSGAATADGGSPFGAAAGGGASGGGSGGGASADGATAVGGGGGEDEGTGKKLGGLFDVAKSALGNLFKGKAGDKGSFDGVNKNGSNYSDANGLDSKKWRPRGMVRGLAGDNELAGKFEDIWKVMNKQYKVQDQKDSFIFGGETK